MINPFDTNPLEPLKLLNLCYGLYDGTHILQKIVSFLGVAISITR